MKKQFQVTLRSGEVVTPHIYRRHGDGVGDLVVHAVAVPPGTPRPERAEATVSEATTGLAVRLDVEGGLPAALAFAATWRALVEADADVAAAWRRFVAARGDGAALEPDRLVVRARLVEPAVAAAWAVERERDAAPRRGRRARARLGKAPPPPPPPPSADEPPLTGDLHCAVCAEPWSPFGVLGAADMSREEAAFLVAGQGCPCCRGVAPSPERRALARRWFARDVLVGAVLEGRGEAAALRILAEDAEDAEVPA